MKQCKDETAEGSSPQLPGADIYFSALYICDKILVD
jgi:hypothetical protein